MHAKHIGRDASRAAALNYRPDAILMRSIIYGARHRPLNIPRSTKESSRDPELFRGRCSRIAGREQRYSHRRGAARLLFSRTSNGVREKPGLSRGRGTCRHGERFLRRNRSEEDNR